MRTKNLNKTLLLLSICLNFSQIIKAELHLCNSQSISETFNVSATAVSCDGTTQLSSDIPSNAAFFYWTIISGSATFENATSVTTNVSNLTLGQNTFRLIVTLDDGSQLTEDITVTNNQIDDPQIIGDVNSVNICESTYDFNAVTPSVGIGTWILVSGSGVIENPNSPTSTVIGLAQGENKFLWMVQNENCYATVEFTINNQKVDVDAGLNQAVCESIAELNAVEPMVGTGEWNLVSDGGGALFFPNRYVSNPTVSITPGTTKLIWSVTNNSCVSRDTVTIYNNKPGPINAGTDIEVPANLAYLDAIPPTVGIGRWSLIEGSGIISDAINPSAAVSNLLTGNNIFRWTVTNELCSEYDEVIITAGSATIANAGGDQFICTDSTTGAANVPSDGRGSWSIITGSGFFEDINNGETTITNLANGENILRWTIYNSNGFSTYDDVSIFNNSPSLANAGLDMRVADTSVELDARLPVFGQGTWSLIEGSGIFSDASNHKATVSNLSPGNNIFRWTVTNESCSEFDEVMVLSGTSTNIQKVNVNTTIFPNPANLFIDIRSAVEIKSVSIYSSTGTNVLYADGYNKTNLKLNIQPIASGIYIIKITGFDGSVITKKLIKKINL
ncbi:PKD domain-containing protein [Saccharicrinis aurantiacus]|uniref:PKD domain-containing protein n=1 Tax=Saccharicrinis aurantiacus TaxID=1849719 RepID=UPI00249200BC|nr:T9SS type A sorting domain-containing protein [Saccharicrinis aurantiacus]